MQDSLFFNIYIEQPLAKTSQLAMLFSSADKWEMARLKEKAIKHTIVVKNNWPCRTLTLWVYIYMYVFAESRGV